ncbi:hypothetical protein [Comamonas sp. HJ-2]
MNKRIEPETILTPGELRGLFAVLKDMGEPESWPEIGLVRLPGDIAEDGRTGLYLYEVDAPEEGCTGPLDSMGEVGS